MNLKSAVLLAVVLLCYKISSAQTHYPYRAAWRIIDSLIQEKSLPKSALDAVDKLLAVAKKENEEDQWVKAVIYRQQLLATAQEDITKRQQQLEEEITTAPPRVAAILRSFAAETLYYYGQRQRDRLSGRTELQQDSATDISTWTTGRLNQKIRRLYLGSLKMADLLQRTNLDTFDVAVLKGNVRYLRPTLYDLLAYRALDYFQADDPEQPLAEDAFRMNSPAVFLPARSFMVYPFSGSGDSSNHEMALKIFQSLLKFHSRDEEPDAGLDADIHRLVFVNRYAVIPQKDSLYLAALRNITASHPSLPVSAQAWYLQAAFFSKQAAGFDPLNDTSNRYGYVTAKAICEEVVTQEDSSEGKTNCLFLLQQILRKTCTVKTEKVNLPDLPFRALVTYKNIPRLYVRMLRVDDATRERLAVNSWDSKTWEKLSRFPVFKSFDQALPETNDYQTHRVEIRVDALPAGQYALLTSSDSSFGDSAVLTLQYFFCSSIAFVNEGPDYFVVDRDSGKPLTGVQVKTFYSVYDSKRQKRVFHKSGRYKTDEHGFFRMAPRTVDRYGQTKLEFYYRKDYLSVSDQAIYYHSNGEPELTDAAAYEQKMLRDILFADRSLYRPGQTVYFNGLLVTKDFISKRYKIVTDEKRKLFLLDVHQQRVDSLAVTPDEFGSFHGSFHLPGDLLNGEFTIRDSALENDALNFSVEDYKRPKFYVRYDSLKDAYGVGDRVRLTGSAMAYAGNTISDSKVRYRVFRASRFPYPWFFRRLPSNPEQEITHGETITDDQGKFEIRFDALPDQHIKKESKPVFIYRVETEVTDQNGETRSASTTVAAGYQTFQIVCSMAPEGHALPNGMDTISVTTQNASGQFLPEMLTVRLYKLKPPARLIRKRYWEEPDQFVMTEEEYVSSFPHDEYRNETDKANWKRVEKLAESTGRTRADGLFELNAPANARRATVYPAGWYLIECSAKDRDGETITDKRYVELMDSYAEKPDYPTYQRSSAEEQTREPGQEATIQTGTTATDLFVIRVRRHPDDSVAAYSFYQLSNGIHRTSLQIEEKDRGGFGVNDVFVKNNRWYSSNHTIHVPWTNKELQISYETWRDKLLPGSAEKWKIRISGYKKNRVAAEVLTAMYDASLDQFKEHRWNMPDLYPAYSEEDGWNGNSDFDDETSMQKPVRASSPSVFNKIYDRLVWSAGAGPENILTGPLRGVVVVAYGLKSSRPPVATDSQDMLLKSAPLPDAKEEASMQHAEPQPVPEAGIQIRKNFNETAFFLPDLQTDAEGDVEISFTIPEALTRWKWMIFAHTRELAFGYSEKTVLTQKELMLQPNMPRFFRQGDSMYLPVKISNLSKGSMAGFVQLDWLDATDSSGQNRTLGNTRSRQPFRAEAGQSTVVYFSTVIPAGFEGPILYRLQAKTNNGAAADGEQGMIPVMGNRLLVMETLPLNMAGRNSKQFTLSGLLNSKPGSTWQNQSLTVEYSSNAAWYAVQSLPYLMEFPYECAEQTFNRFYANALATQIVRSSSGIREVFEQWKNADSAALRSNLQKDDALKTVLLRETPWLLDAQNEHQQKKNLALLFDTDSMRGELKSALRKLKQMQSPGGGFPWFKGGRDDRYITQTILAGIGHLKKLKAVPADEESLLHQIARAAIGYLDGELKGDYDRRPEKAEQDISPVQIQYLYMRSFFPETGLPGSVFPAMNYYRKQAVQYWPKQNMYLRGMIALFLYRTGDRKTASDIMASLKENASVSEALGMYWKSVKPGYYWQESPVETQSLLIEAFHEINPETASPGAMEYWLLRQKQVQHWSTTRATADACYALLLNGGNWLSRRQTVQIRLGDSTMRWDAGKTEAGTGYRKHVIPGNQVRPAMGDIRVTLEPEAGQQTVPSWGAVYWQYFENIDRITAASSPLSLSKTLYIEKKTKGGLVLESLPAGNTLQPGDKLMVRIVIRSDRNMEYIHLKDMRAACLEPAQVLSGYHWQGNLGYYETTQDESTSFFFDYLPAGVHVFEYPLYVTTEGVYSNGISTLQCMYAPEFAAHTAGLRIRVKKK